jgi:hypothetical protein
LALPEAEMSRLRRRGFWLEYASMAWMTVDCLTSAWGDWIRCFAAHGPSSRHTHSDHCG